MDERYADVDGRKVVYSSLNPADLFRNANKFTYILLALIVVIVLIVVLLFRLISKISKKLFNKK